MNLIFYESVDDLIGNVIRRSLLGVISDNISNNNTTCNSNTNNSINTINTNNTININNNNSNKSLPYYKYSQFSSCGNFIISISNKTLLIKSIQNNTTTTNSIKSTNFYSLFNTSNFILINNQNIQPTLFDLNLKKQQSYNNIISEISHQFYSCFIINNTVLNCSNSKIFINDIHSFNYQNIIKTNKKGIISSIDFNKDKSGLFTIGQYNGLISLYDFNTFELLYSFKNTSKNTGITQTTFSNDGQLLFTSARMSNLITCCFNFLICRGYQKYWACFV